MRLFVGRYLYALQDVAFCSPKGHVSHGKRPRFAASFAVFYIVAFAVLVKKETGLPLRQVRFSCLCAVCGVFICLGSP